MSQDAPSTGHDPETVSRYAVSRDSTQREFLAAAKLYARDVVESTALSVDVDALEWEVSTRAKRRAGGVKHRDGEPRVVSLTWDYFQHAGWEPTAGIVRHELIHAHLLAEAGDASHGDAFERLAEALEAPRYCERFSEPKWWVCCTKCDNRLARYRTSSLTEHPERYACGDCGGRLRVRPGSGKRR